MKETIYYVWRRSDGYVAVTACRPRDRDVPGKTFEILLETADWLAAHARVNAERTADSMCADMKEDS